MAFTIYRDASDLGTVGRDEKNKQTKNKKTIKTNKKKHQQQQEQQQNNCIINFKEKMGYFDRNKHAPWRSFEPRINENDT